MFRARAVALVSYTAEAADELSFEQNDIVNIKSTKGGHWWYGVHKGRAGCVPKKFFELQVLDKCIVTKPYHSTKTDQLKLEEDDVVDILIKENDEWYGRINNSEGWFPQDCVVPHTQQQASHSRPISAPNSTSATKSTFDEITENITLINDPRRERPQRPAVRKPYLRSRSIDELESETESHTYEIPEIPSREIKPKPIERLNHQFMNDLKSKLNRQPSDADKPKPAEGPTNLSKVPSKSIPNLSSALNEENKINSSPSRFFSPKPFSSSNSNLAGKVDAELSSDQELEKRVELLEKMTRTMMEQLTDIKKELIRLKLSN